MLQRSKRASKVCWKVFVTGRNRDRNKLKVVSLLSSPVSPVLIDPLSALTPVGPDPSVNMPFDKVNLFLPAPARCLLRCVFWHQICYHLFHLTCYCSVCSSPLTSLSGCSGSHCFSRKEKRLSC